jgi:hypothetical protein
MMYGAIVKSWKEVLWIESFYIAVEPIDPSTSNIFPTFPFSHLIVLLRGRLFVITFTSNKWFGLVVLGWKGVQQGEKEKAFNALILTSYSRI